MRGGGVAAGALAVLIAVSGCSSSPGGGKPVRNAGGSGGAASPTPSTSASSAPSAATEGLFAPTAVLDHALDVYPSRAPAGAFFVSVGEAGPGAAGAPGGFGGDATVVTTRTAAGTEVAHAAAGAVDTSCILAVTGSSPRSGSLLWARAVETPAAGVTPASWTLSVVSMDTSTYATRWATPLVSNSPQSVGCDNAHDATVTSDGHWLAYGQWVVNLTDGKVRDLGEGKVPRALGNDVMVFDGVCANCINAMPSLPVTDPATGRQLFAFTDHDLIAQLSEPDEFAASADGSTLFVDRLVPGTGDGPLTYSLEARSLATGAVTWQKTGVSYTGPRSQKVVVDDPAGVVVMPDQAAANAAGGAPDGPQSVIGYSVADGTRLWALPGATVCTADAADIAVTANSQLAVVDPHTGHQSAYTAQRTDCGVPLGEHAYYTADGAVVRVLPAN